jgi:hypothetical protein
MLIPHHNKSSVNEPNIMYLKSVTNENYAANKIKQNFMDQSTQKVIPIGLSKNTNSNL